MVNRWRRVWCKKHSVSWVWFMSEIFALVHLAWESIWKQKNIWLFSALPVAAQFFPSNRLGPDSSFLQILFILLNILVLILFWLAGTIGVPYLSYRFAIGKPATIRETLMAIRKFSGRVLKLSCLSVIVLIPCLFSVWVISAQNSRPLINFSNNLALAAMPLSIFAAFWDFSIAGFFVGDLKIRESIKNAWALYANHFSFLATTGIILAVAFWVLSVTAAIATLFIQSRFDTASLQDLNIISPYTALSNNLLFQLIVGGIQIIWSPFSTSIFILAFVNYSKIKPINHTTSRISAKNRP